MITWRFAAEVFLKLRTDAGQECSVNSVGVIVVLAAKFSGEL